jgi:hypothetical protein
VLAERDGARHAREGIAANQRRVPARELALLLAREVAD